MQINTIIFDLGGVLIDWNPEYVFQHVIPDPEKRRYFFENICTHEWNMEQDAGRLIADATNALVEEHPDWETEIRAFYGRWEEMLGGTIDGTVALLAELRDGQKHRLLALTNWSHETFPVAQERYEFLQWFEGILVSGEEKMRKPHPEIYDLLLKRYEIEPAKAVFIDDNQHNVEAAGKFGIHAIQFTGPEKLRSDLADLGII